MILPRSIGRLQADAFGFQSGAVNGLRWDTVTGIGSGDGLSCTRRLEVGFGWISAIGTST